VALDGHEESGKLLNWDLCSSSDVLDTGGRLATLNDGCYLVFCHIDLFSVLAWLCCDLSVLFWSTPYNLGHIQRVQLREHQKAVRKSQEDTSYFLRESGALAQEGVMILIFILEDTIYFLKNSQKA
jgi:hypothetical protein